MTKPTSAHSSRGPAAPAGFTLIELLVVIGIIAVLIGLLSPMITRAYRNAERSRGAADLQAIATALDAYKLDFGSYPQIAQNPDWAAGGPDAERPNPVTGAQLLCQALIGPAQATELGVAATVRPRQDGADGPGFRTRRNAGPDGVMNNADDNLNSKLYPPYLPPDKFKIADPRQPGTAITNDTALKAVLIDRFSMPILYYPAVGNPNIRAANGYAGVGTATVKPRFQHNHNPPVLNSGDEKRYAPDLESFQRLLGDGATGSAPDGMIQPGETPAATGPFLLWSAGPDEVFGPRPGVDDVSKSDDVTNFRQ